MLNRKIIACKTFVPDRWNPMVCNTCRLGALSHMDDKNKPAHQKNDDEQRQSHQNEDHFRFVKSASVTADRLKLFKDIESKNKELEAKDAELLAKTQQNKNARNNAFTSPRALPNVPPVQANTFQRTNSNSLSQHGTISRGNHSNHSNNQAESPRQPPSLSPRQPIAIAAPRSPRQSFTPTSQPVVQQPVVKPQPVQQPPPIVQPPTVVPVQPPTVVPVQPTAPVTLPEPVVQPQPQLPPVSLPPVQPLQLPEPTAVKVDRQPSPRALPQPSPRSLPTPNITPPIEPPVTPAPTLPEPPVTLPPVIEPIAIPSQPVQKTSSVSMISPRLPVLPTPPTLTVLPPEPTPNSKEPASSLITSAPTDLPPLPPQESPPLAPIPSPHRAIPFPAFVDSSARYIPPLPPSEDATPVSTSPVSVTASSENLNSSDSEAQEGKLVRSNSSKLLRHKAFYNHDTSAAKSKDQLIASPGKSKENLAPERPKSCAPREVHSPRHSNPLADEGGSAAMSPHDSVELPRESPRAADAVGEKKAPSRPKSHVPDAVPEHHEPQHTTTTGSEKVSEVSTGSEHATSSQATTHSEATATSTTGEGPEPKREKPKRPKTKSPDGAVRTHKSASSLKTHHEQHESSSSHHHREKKHHSLDPSVSDSHLNAPDKTPEKKTLVPKGMTVPKVNDGWEFPKDEIFQPVKIEVRSTRDNVINEIVSTEQSYVYELHVLNEVFKKEMLNSAELGRIEMTKEEVAGLFGYSDIIQNVNTQMLKNMLERLKTWNHETSTICDLLNDLGPFLKVYKTYSVIVDKAVLFIKDYDRKKMPLLTKFFEERRANPICKGLDFCSFLTSPVKRIPRYLLLIGELKKFTEKEFPPIPVADGEAAPTNNTNAATNTNGQQAVPNPAPTSSHPEVICLEKARKLLSDIAISVNTEVNLSDQRNTMFELQQKLTFDDDLWNFQLIVPNRSFVKEFEIYYANKKKKVPGNLFLFNNLVIVAKNLKVKTWCFEIFPTSPVYTPSKSDKEKFAFELVFPAGGANNPPPLVIYAKSADDLKQFSEKYLSIQDTLAKQKQQREENAKKIKEQSKQVL